MAIPKDFALEELEDLPDYSKLAEFEALCQMYRSDFDKFEESYRFFYECFNNSQPNKKKAIKSPLPEPSYMRKLLMGKAILDETEWPIFDSLQELPFDPQMTASRVFGIDNCFSSTQAP